MPTLVDYWTDEVSRIDAALTTSRGTLDTLRSQTRATETAARDLADEVKAHGDAVAAARRALASIPMPADGDPLLAQMQTALVDLHNAQARVAETQRQLLTLKAAVDQGEADVRRLDSELTAAEATLAAETRVRENRQAILDRFGTDGMLENLITDAQTALTDHESTARTRVEGEFPTNSNAAKSLLARTRARAQLVRDIVTSTANVELAAYAGQRTALEVAQRAYDAALAALLTLGEAGARARADITTLTRLAALPAASAPDTYPILTRWQHELLHDSSKKTKRENTLAKLTAVDDARTALIPLQAAYDQALHAAMKTEPDKTVAELDATTVSAEKAAVDGQLLALDTARSAYTSSDPANLQLLDEWFAAIPDTLWSALESFDGAVARLQSLATGPSPASLDSAIDAAETALEVALNSARATQRQTLGSQRAHALAEAAWAAQRNTAAAQATAMSHSNALF